MFALNALNALARIYPSLALTHRRPGDPQFLVGLEPGQRLRATVQANLAADEFVVSLHMPQTENRQTLHMKLPANVQPGDVLNLVFVSQKPRPTFALVSNVLSAGISPLLSETGRFIDNLLRGPIISGGPTALPGAACFHFPLLASPPTDSAELAQSLASAFRRSGLFYEAHQAQWIAGARPLTELLLEPQARLFRLPLETSAGFAVPNAEPTTTVSANDTVADASHPAHPEILAMVRQQLEVFETRHFAWQGMAWPGQTIAWEVAEEKPQLTQEQEAEQGAARQPSTRWRTGLCLTLPNLGQVGASLRLDAEGAGSVEIRFTAAEPMTAGILRTGAIPLANGLESAGIKLLGMGVEIDEKT
ncbi:MAG: flagellar hook-length control protein FliK [Pseudomonadota bacterium]|nr:flagellar hook-length control protein FliK [Pseudomonadota bacterium]